MLKPTLNLLQAIYLRVRKIAIQMKVTVIKFRVDNRGSDGFITVIKSR